MIVKNLLLIYHGHLFASYFPNSKALIGTGTQIEDAITSKQININENNFRRVGNSRILKILLKLATFHPNNHFILSKKGGISPSYAYH